MDSDSNASSCGGRSFVAFIATGIFIVAFLLIFVGMVAPDWLAVDEQKAPPSTKFEKLGLWMSCYKLLHDPYYYDPYLTGGYNGCRWIYYPVTVTFNDLREYILPGFLVPVQISYALCFVAAMAGLFMVIAYFAKFSSADAGLVHYLIITGMLINMSALLGTVAVIVFGTLGGSRLWAPEWQFNYLSWAFICAVVGVVLEHIAGTLFLLEASVQWRRSQRSSHHGSYSMSHFNNGGGMDYGKKA